MLVGKRAKKLYCTHTSIRNCPGAFLLPKKIKAGGYMPARFKKQCKKIGCSNLTDNANGYCVEHQPERYRYDKARLSSYQRGYDNRWRKYRLWFLEYHPLCSLCGDPATVVDHIIPHKGDKKLFWDANNHQALCKACHDAKTAREDGGFGNMGRG